MNKTTVIRSLSAPISLASRASGDRSNQKHRNRFMRDRDRILYSKAFRRLAGKTQVFFAHSDDHKRTRLTHTLEVAQIAKTISSALNLDIDLTEAIALGHDIGHTPFGHAGERILHEIMSPNYDKNEILLDKCFVKKSPMELDSISLRTEEKYGFKHNYQSVRIAVELERMYGNKGLDLTNFTLFGMLNHSSLLYGRNTPNNDSLNFYHNMLDYCKIDRESFAWSFEAFVVSEADEIAQRHHDLEDAITGKLITCDVVVKLIKDSFEDFMSTEDRHNYHKLKTNRDNVDLFVAQLSKTIVNMLVSRMIRSSIDNINDLINRRHMTKKRFVDFIESANIDEMKRVISYDKVDDRDSSFTNAVKSFAEKISERTVSSHDIQLMDSKGQYIIRKLFEAFYSNPQQLPDNSILAFYRKEGRIYTNENSIENDLKINGIGHIRAKFAKSKNRLDREQQFVLMRTICDHLSGMTDTYAINMFQKLYGGI